MKTIKCKDCGGTISKSAKACRHCGRDYTGGLLVKIAGTFALIVIFIICWPFLQIALYAFLQGFNEGH